MADLVRGDINQCLLTLYLVGELEGVVGYSGGEEMLKLRVKVMLVRDST